MSSREFIAPSSTERKKSLELITLIPTRDLRSAGSHRRGSASHSDISRNVKATTFDFARYWNVKRSEEENYRVLWANSRRESYGTCGRR